MPSNLANPLPAYLPRAMYHAHSMLDFDDGLEVLGSRKMRRRARAKTKALASKRKVERAKAAQVAVSSDSSSDSSS